MPIIVLCIALAVQLGQIEAADALRAASSVNSPSHGQQQRVRPASDYAAKPSSIIRSDVADGFSLYTNHEVATNQQQPQQDQSSSSSSSSNSVLSRHTDHTFFASNAAYMHARSPNQLVQRLQQQEEGQVLSVQQQQQHNEGSHSRVVRHLLQQAASSSSTDLVAPVDYTYRPHNLTDITVNVPAADSDGIRVTRWVVTAWSISNFSSPGMLNTTTVQQVHKLISGYMNISLGQVFLNASANVTIGYAFNGISQRDQLKWVPAHKRMWDKTVTEVMKTVGADMAGGYAQNRMRVLFNAPYYGMNTSRWAVSDQPSVLERDMGNASQALGEPASANRNRRMLLLQQYAHRTQQQQQQQQYTQHTQQQQQQQLITDHMRSRFPATAATVAAEPGPMFQAPSSAQSAAAAHPMFSRSPSTARQLQQVRAQPLDDATEPTPVERPRVLQDLVKLDTLTPIWVVYTQMDPLNVTALLDSLSASCDGVALKRGVDVGKTSCGIAMLQAFQAAGLPVKKQQYQQIVIDAPVVSLNIRLAVGLTEHQASAGLDHALAAWLAQPNMVSAAVAADPSVQLGPDALIKWLQTPEIWSNLPMGPPSQRPSTVWTPGAVAGLAIGIATCFGITVGVVVFLLLRMYKKRHPPAAAVKNDSESTNGSTVTTSTARARRRKQGKKRYLLPVPHVPSQTGQSQGAVHTATVADGAGSSAAAAEGTPDAAAAAASTVDPFLEDQDTRPCLKELGDSVTSAVRWEQDDDDDDADQQQQQQHPGSGVSTAAAVASLAAAAAAVAGAGASITHNSGSRSSRGVPRQPPIAEHGEQQRQSGAGDHIAAAAAAQNQQQQPQLDLAALGIIGSPTALVSANGSSSGTRASPFACAYDFGDLAAAAAAAGEGSRGYSSSSGRPVTECPIEMVSAGSSYGAAIMSPTAAAAAAASTTSAAAAAQQKTSLPAASSLSGVGSTKLAVCADGSYQSFPAATPSTAAVPAASGDVSSCYSYDVHGSAADKSSGSYGPFSSSSAGRYTSSAISGVYTATGGSTARTPRTSAASGTGSTRASPFAVAYNFGELAADGVLPAAAAGGISRRSSNSSSRPLTECPTDMISAGSSFGAVAATSPVPAAAAAAAAAAATVSAATAAATSASIPSTSSLDGVGSMTIAMSTDGNFQSFPAAAAAGSSSSAGSCSHYRYDPYGLATGGSSSGYGLLTGSTKGGQSGTNHRQGGGRSTGPFTTSSREHDSMAVNPRRGGVSDSGGVRRPKPGAGSGSSTVKPRSCSTSGTTSTRASPFATGYDFGELAAAARPPSRSNSSNGSRPITECPTDMVGAGSSFGAAVVSPTAAAAAAAAASGGAAAKKTGLPVSTSLNGVGSMQLAMSTDGSFVTLPCPTAAVTAAAAAAAGPEPCNDSIGLNTWY